MARKKTNKSETSTENTQSTDIKKEEYDKLQAEFDAQKDQFMRLAAEYDNFRKRTEKEKTMTYDNAVAATVEAFLPVVDNFGLALASSADVSDEFKKGLEMIQKQFETTFEKLKVESFGERGEEFNPELHNAIARTTDPELEEDHIAMVYQKGYKIGDKIIRHAMVQISE